MTKKERKANEAWERIKDAIRDCGPDGGATLLITDDGGKPSSTGRTHKLEVRVIRSTTVEYPGREPDGAGRGLDTRPRVCEALTYDVARALGYRLDARDRIIMGGYGYSRSLRIASALAYRAGHPIYCDSDGGFASAQGWIK